MKQRTRGYKVRRKRQRILKIMDEVGLNMKGKKIRKAYGEKQWGKKK